MFCPLKRLALVLSFASGKQSQAASEEQTIGTGEIGLMSEILKIADIGDVPTGMCLPAEIEGHRLEQIPFLYSACQGLRASSRAAKPRGLKPAARHTISRIALALFKLDGEYYAIDDTCPHSGASMSEGDWFSEYRSISHGSNTYRVTVFL